MNLQQKTLNLPVGYLLVPLWSIQNGMIRDTHSFLPKGVFLFGFFAVLFPVFSPVLVAVVVVVVSVVVVDVDVDFDGPAVVDIFAVVQIQGLIKRNTLFTNYYTS